MALRAISAALLACVACHHPRETPRVAVEVRAQLPGMSADEVATSVTTVLEHELATVPHVAAMSSVTTAGAARIRVMLDSEDMRSGVHAAIVRAMPNLPGAMPPPAFSVVGAPAGRFLVPRDNASLAAERAATVPGVGGVEVCGERRREKVITVDLSRLAGLGLGLADIIDVLRSGTPARDFGDVLVMNHNGIPVFVRDLAIVEDTVQPPACDLIATSPAVAELVVDAQHAADANAVHAAVAKAITGAVAVPWRSELHAQLAPDADLATAPAFIRDALARAGGSYLVELRGRDLRIVDGGDAALAALRTLPFVADGGEPTTVVHVSGASRQAITATAQAIEARLRQAGILVGVRGLATTTTIHYEVDRARAEELGVTPPELATTLAATAGVDVATRFTAADAQRVIVRARLASPADLATLYVHGTAGRVPVSSVVTSRSASEPVEIVRHNNLPAIDLEVHGDPATAIGAVPAGIRVDVEPFP